MTNQNKFYTAPTTVEIPKEQKQPELKPDNEIIDKDGNVIVLQEITGKMRLAFYRALGAKDSTNQAVILELWPVMAVKSINNDPTGILDSVAKIELIHARLDAGDATAKIMQWLADKESKHAEFEKEEKNHIKK